MNQSLNTKKYIFDHSPQGGQKDIIILECIPEDKNNFKNVDTRLLQTCPE